MHSLLHSLCFVSSICTLTGDTVRYPAGVASYGRKSSKALRGFSAGQSAMHQFFSFHCCEEKEFARNESYH
jgi:hypothetical protein